MKRRNTFFIFLTATALFLNAFNAVAGLTPVITPGTDQTLSVFDDSAILRKALIPPGSAAALGAAEPVVNNQLVLQFFSDSVYTVRVEKVSSGYAGARICEGSAINAKETLFQSVVTADGVRYELNDNKRGIIYQATSLYDGSLRIIEYDKSRGEPIIPSPCLHVPDENPSSMSGIGTLSSGSGVETLSNTEIDVMLVFDQSAQTWANANGGITAVANAAIAKMNTAHALSGTECSFRLVHVYLSDFTYDSSSTDLADVLYDIYYERGDVSEVSPLRDSVGADIAAMLVDTGSAYGTTGIGFTPSSSSGSSTAAFSVSSIRSVNISHTMTHEIGHNLGCDHSKNQSSEPGPGVFTYAAGWYFTGGNNTKYHTIMSYNNDGYGNYYQPCGLFSSPLLSFQSSIPGDAADGDNARCIRCMKSIVAAYRTSSFNTVSEPVIIPASGASFSDSLQVTISCATSGAEIRYTTDGSTPGQASTLYTGPVTITESTTFKSIAIKAGMDSSGVVTAAYMKASENDFFADALDIGMPSGTIAGNNYDATKEVGEPNHASAGGASVWWKWTAPKSGVVVFTTDGSSYDTLMGAYTGSSVTSLTTLDSNDDSGGTYQSEVTFAVTAGTDYYIAVDGYNGDEGNIILSWDLEYLEVDTCSVVNESGGKAFRMQFNARAGETYAVKRKDTLSPSESWRDCDPPLTLTAGSDGTYQFDIEIPQSSGKGFFKIIKQ